MLDVHPDKVGSRGSKDLCQKCAWNALSDPEKSLLGIFLGFLQSTLEVSGVRQKSRPPFCLRVQAGVFEVTLTRHAECCLLKRNGDV